MFILIEMQKNGSQAALLPARTFTDKNEAESAYYSILAAAAISAVEVHSVVMMDDHGNTVKHDFYEHGV